MASEQVLEVLMRSHTFDSERPFDSVLDGIFGGISQPDIGQLFSKLAASTSYEQFSPLVRQAQGSIGLMVFLQLDDDSVLALDPQAPDWAGRRLVRLIAGDAIASAIAPAALRSLCQPDPCALCQRRVTGGRGDQIRELPYRGGLWSHAHLDEEL